MSNQKKFSVQLEQLRQLLVSYNQEASEKKLNCLEKLGKTKWQYTQDVLNYQEILLFLAAYPNNEKVLKAAEKEFHRIAKHFAQLKEESLDAYRDSFLPYTSTSLILSHEFLFWLSKLEECKLAFDGMDAEEDALNAVLKVTLPSLESEITSIGCQNEELLEALGIKKHNQLQFLLEEFNGLSKLPKLKDLVWDQLKIWTKIKGTQIGFSKFFNRLEPKQIFYTDELLKRFDHQELFAKALPKAKDLTAKEKERIIKTIKKSMVHTMRETDPATYMDEDTLVFFELERGISIALYGIKAERQMPIQSYIGYTLFKNGYPSAYGGSWILGERAHFGINIYEPYRGGESGYVMCQLLRTYIQLFHLNYIEVDAYQFGRDNADGIKSGAFWFYYRYGFRPIDKSLALLADSESIKIKEKPKYRSSEKTLIKLAQYNMALILGNPNHGELSTLTEKIQSIIIKKFDGNRNLAKTSAIKHFMEISQEKFNTQEKFALEEFAIIYFCFEKQLTNHIQLLTSLIRLKTTDYISYNKSLLQLLKQIIKT